MAKKEAIEVEGMVQQALPNANFRIELANGHEVLDTLVAEFAEIIFESYPGISCRRPAQFQTFVHIRSHSSSIYSFEV